MDDERTKHGDELGKLMFEYLDKKFGVTDDGCCDLQKYANNEGDLSIPNNVGILAFYRDKDGRTELLYTKLINYSIIKIPDK